MKSASALVKRVKRYAGSNMAFAVERGQLPVVTLACDAQRTEDERFVARQEAARGAVNIDWEERQRRLIFGGILLVRPAHLLSGGSTSHT